MNRGLLHSSATSSTPVIPLQTYRLSPKNQVTLPRDARSLSHLGEGGVICGLPSRAIHEDPKRKLPIVTLMTVEVVIERERELREQAQREGQSPFAMINFFNEGLKQMTVDGQRRIVLPPHFVEHLGVERDLLFISTNTSVYVWNPDHYQTWRGEDDERTRLALDRLMV
jgi:DNA-binding transcriptional regulator/RsmH inhibitor MraZ